MTKLLYSAKNIFVMNYITKCCFDMDRFIGFISNLDSSWPLCSGQAYIMLSNAWITFCVLFEWFMGAITFYPYIILNIFNSNPLALICCYHPLLSLVRWSPTKGSSLRTAFHFIHKVLKKQKILFGHLVMDQLVLERHYSASNFMPNHFLCAALMTLLRAVICIIFGRFNKCTFLSFYFLPVNF